VQFPPLHPFIWVTESPEPLTKLSLKGLMGSIEVLGPQYPKVVPMIPSEPRLDEEELTAVLTYVRKSWTHRASPITTEQIANVREDVKAQPGFYEPEKRLKLHPADSAK